MNTLTSEEKLRSMGKWVTNPSDTLRRKRETQQQTWACERVLGKEEDWEKKTNITTKLNKNIIKRQSYMYSG